jgi:aspartyl-tRNA synthetase
MEMSFADGDDVMVIIENLIKALWNDVQGTAISAQPGSYLTGPRFTQMSYDDAMSAYGSDKPDLRFPSRVSASPLHRFS